MSQHVLDTCIESNGNWLPITEFSVKSGMSLSTIRRKIKSNSIAYRLDKGKYFILFSNREVGDMRPIETRNALIPAKQPEKQPTSSRSNSDEDAFQMVSEAYEYALREKDERIKLLEQKTKDLEERLQELRLLVQVLEEKYEVRY